MKNQIDNPSGLHKRYHIQKIVTESNPHFSHDSILGLQDPYIQKTIPVDQGSEYFVLRLDTGGSDIEHIKAGRVGIHAYAEAIKHHLPQLSEDLIKRYPLL